MDKQLPEFCFTFDGISTGIQVLHHVILFRITNGLPLGTSNTDSWRLKPSIRCQVLVDRSELCTSVIFNFSQFILKASARKKRRQKEKKVSACSANVGSEHGFDSRPRARPDVGRGPAQHAGA